MAAETATLEPTVVLYCGKCGMPPEYCEYGPDFESHCDPWLLKHHPDIHCKLASLRTTKPTKTKKADGDDDGNAGDANKPTKPTEPWTTEQRLTAFYEKYQPEKVSDVPTLLEKYAGKEDNLFKALTKKYGPEPDDPYYDDSEDDEDSDDDDEEEGIEGDMSKLNVDGKKRRGKAANKTSKVQTRVVIQKVTRRKHKATTIIVGMESVPGIKLKDVSKAFSKRFAGSSSVKDGVKGKEIIIQGDHMEDVAAMVVKQFNVPGSAVFLDMDGEFVSYA